jgi:hypothetical protein
MYDGPRIIPERFWARIKREGDCWIWTGGKNVRNGRVYGRTYIEGGRRQAFVQRIAYELSTGQLLPRGAIIKQRCDNLLCINPNHLYRAKRSRANAKLTSNQVIEIREQHAAGTTVAELSRLYGVAQATIDNAVKRKTWIDL